MGDINHRVRLQRLNELREVGAQEQIDSADNYGARSSMRCGILLTTLLGLLVSHGAAQNSERRDIEGKLLALERVGKLQAIQLKDLKMLDEVLDENFVLVDQDGLQLNKAQVLAYVQKATSLRYLASEMTARLHGNTAIVTGVYRLDGVLAGRRFEQHGRFVDTWIERKGKWLAIASLSTPLS